MDKIKIDMKDAFKKADTKVITAANGTELEVVNHIPFDQKVEFAFAQTQMNLVVDEEEEVCYESYLADLNEAFLFAQYYTNIDTSDLDTEEGRKAVFDYLVNNDVYQNMRNYAADDLAYTMGLYYSLSRSAKEVFQERHSLSYKFKKSFGSLLTGEDIAETLAKSAEITDKMTEMMDAFREKQDNISLFSSVGKTPQDKGKRVDKMKVAGTIINMAKK